MFPLLHGPYGEDGTIQGMLEMADIPYIGAGVLASSLCMDKPMSKDVLAGHDIPQVRWVVTTRRELREDPDAVIARCSELPAPWFVKPANLGSSVGITRVTDAAELRAALKLTDEEDEPLRELIETWDALTEDEKSDALSEAMNVMSHILTNHPAELKALILKKAAENAAKGSTE